MEAMIQTEDMDLDDIFDESLLPDEKNQKLEDEVSRCKVKANLEISSLTTLSYNLETQKSSSNLFSIDFSSRDNEFTGKISACTAITNDLNPTFSSWSSGNSILLNTYSIPKLFDMRNRSDGLVIRDSIDMDDYLEQNSPDSPLLKSTEVVLNDLQSHDLDQETLLDEQRAIEADLATQQLIDPALRLLQASKVVPDDLKSGLPLGDTTIALMVDKGKQPMEQEPKTRAKKRQASTNKQESRKKQHSEEARVEAASPKWLPADK
ncbi:hypothetical protein LINGRAHAP2_LOCUS31071 [Linum grandiflorum]